MDNKLLRAGGRAAILLSAVRVATAMVRRISAKGSVVVGSVRSRAVAFRRGFSPLLLALLGLLLMNLPAAAAVSGQRLSGPFAVHEIVTAETNIFNTSVGDTADVQWEFTPQCTTGACDTVIVRHLVAGFSVSYTLHLQADGTYTGSGSFQNYCYVSGVGTPNGTDEGETMTLVPDPGGTDVHTFSGSFSEQGTVNATGIAAGCVGNSSESISFTGKTAGTVTGVTVEDVTPTTALYHVTLDISVSNVTCPEDVQVYVGGASRLAHVCDAGQTAPAVVRVDLPVFDNNSVNPYSLSPDGPNTVLAYIVSNSHTAFNGSVMMPAPPVWIGVGDSFTSGHHQDASDFSLHCQIPLSALVFAGLGTSCNTHPNDPSYSWVSQVAGLVNQNLDVPTEWHMGWQDVGVSGMQAENLAKGSKQNPSEVTLMQQFLTQYPGSWNVVSLTGGADDGPYTFVDALTKWYALGLGALWSKTPPWVSAYPVCPDSNSAYAAFTKPNVQAAILNGLQNVVKTAQLTSHGTRIVDVNYPDILPAGNSCAVDHTVAGRGGHPPTIWHGANDGVDVLATIHLRLSGPGITHVDLRPAFNFDDIQHTLYLGYPHPNVNGQALIATLASNAAMGR